METRLCTELWEALNSQCLAQKGSSWALLSAFVQMLRGVFSACP